MVLPAEPVMPAITRPGSRSTTALASAAERCGDVGDDQGGTSGGPGAERDDGSRCRGSGREVVPVGALAGQRREQRAWLDLPGVDHDRAGNQGGRVGHVVEDGAGDAVRFDRSRAGSRAGAPGPRVALRAQNRGPPSNSSSDRSARLWPSATAACCAWPGRPVHELQPRDRRTGLTWSPTYCPRSWPLPAMRMTSPLAAPSMAIPIAAARSGSTMTCARSRGGTDQRSR